MRTSLASSLLFGFWLSRTVCVGFLFGLCFGVYFLTGKTPVFFLLLCTALKNHGGEIGYHNSNRSPSRVYHLRGDYVFAFDLCVDLFEE